MDRYLVTGAAGFVAGHLLDFLDARQRPAEILAIDARAPGRDLARYRNLSVRFEQHDLLDGERLAESICSFGPRFVVHLASFSSVAHSWRDPVASFRNNTNIFLNLLEIVRTRKVACRILSVGSSEEYGPIQPHETPITERRHPNPQSPYAVARVAQESISEVYVRGYGLDIVLTRSFNHIGPGQRDTFAVSSFARQIIDIERGRLGCGELLVGDVDVVRDFTDVRDVVRAYELLLEKGERGQIYNVCSGRGVTLRHVVDRMASLVGVEVTLRTDSERMRPAESRLVVGSNEKLRLRTGWTPQIDLDKSLRDILEFWRRA